MMLYSGFVKNILVACLMAAASFLINKTALKKIGVGTVLFYSPLVEEAAKTLPAYLLGADILIVHIVFGALEAGYDLLTNKSRAVFAAILSLAGHSLFGFLTVSALAMSGSIAAALTAGVLFHLAWNVTIIMLGVKEGRK